MRGSVFCIGRRWQCRNAMLFTETAQLLMITCLQYKFFLFIYIEIVTALPQKSVENDWKNGISQIVQVSDPGCIGLKPARMILKQPQFELEKIVRRIYRKLILSKKCSMFLLFSQRIYRVSTSLSDTAPLLFVSSWNLDYMCD